MNMVTKKRILLVEDEPHLAFHLEFNLQAEGYEVIPAQNGLIALEKHKNFGPFDLIILDVMVPEINGFEILKRVRESDDHTGILMLTALASESDRLKGLEWGADDYITKPFHLKELLLRVRRMVKRAELFSSSQKDGTTRVSEQVLKCEGLDLDIESLTLTSKTGVHALTALECEVLSEFMKHPNRVLSREHLLEKVWGLRASIETRTVDNFVLRLRRYIEVDPANPYYLESIRGRGYRLNSKITEE